MPPRTPRNVFSSADVDDRSPRPRYGDPVDNRSYTAKSRLVRLSHDDLIRLVREADDLMTDARARVLDERRSELRNGRYGSMTEERITAKALEYIEDVYPSAPSWTISSRRDDLTVSSSAPPEEVAPTISLPKRHRYVSIRLSVGGNRIRLWVARSGGAEIDVSSSDHRWFLMAKAWADEALRSVSPRYRWIASPWLYPLVLLLGSLISVVSSLSVVGSDYTPLTIAGTIVGLALMATALALTLVPHSVIGPERTHGGAGAPRVLSGYVVAGIIGWIVARVGDTLVP